MKATRVKDLRRRCQKYGGVLRHLQMLHSEWICSAINQLMSLSGSRMCRFQSLKHFGWTLTLASWMLSQADPFLPKLSGVPFFFCFVFLSCCPYLPPFFSHLLFLSLCRGCLFSLSVGLHSCTASVVERSSTLLCCSANPLCKCTQQRCSVSVVFFFLIISWLRFFVLCFLHLAHVSHWTIFILKKSKKLMSLFRKGRGKYAILSQNRTKSEGGLQKSVKQMWSHVTWVKLLSFQPSNVCGEAWSVVLAWLVLSCSALLPRLEQAVSSLHLSETLALGPTVSHFLWILVSNHSVAMSLSAPAASLEFLKRKHTSALPYTLTH